MMPSTYMAMTLVSLFADEIGRSLVRNGSDHDTACRPHDGSTAATATGDPATLYDSDAVARIRADRLERKTKAHARRYPARDNSTNGRAAGEGEA
jgi:hypothetical protein